jgi:kinetochore-associated protein 1
MRPQKPDVNKIAREIADLHSLEIHVLQMDLLNKWLSLSISEGEGENGNAMEETFYEDFLQNAMETGEPADEFIVCAHYILNGWDKATATSFLVGHLFPTEGVPSTAKQIQIYECFSKLLSGDCDMYSDIFNQQQYLLLRTVHYLKQLGYKFSIEKFSSDGVNKMDVLKNVWQNHAANAKGLEVICYICIGYDIWSSKLWNGVLKQMVRQNMHTQLAALIHLLTAKESLLNTEGLKLAWEYLIKEPFKNANRTRSAEQDAQLAKSLILLQSCPFSARLNLSEIAACCMHINHLHLAAVLIAHSEGEIRENLVQLIGQHKTSSLRGDILSLEEHGVASVIVQHILTVLKL